MIIPIYPTTWYWIVGDTSPTALVWESASGSFVGNTSANYLSWVANGGKGSFDFPIAQVLGAVNNGSGLIRLTLSSTANMTTNDVWVVQNVAGTTEANGTWPITVIDGTHIDLQGSTFTHAYVSGGVIDQGTVIDTKASLLGIIQVYNQNLLLNGQQGWTSEISTIVANKTLTNPVFRFYDITCNAAALSVFLPQANLFGSPFVGQPIIISNNASGGNSFTVKTASGGTLVVLAPGNQVIFTTKNSGVLTSTDGAWDFEPYNTGWAALPQHNQVLAGSSSTVGVPQVPTFRTLGVSDGATGQSTLTPHAVLLGEGTAGVGFATIGTAGRILVDQGGGVDPAFEVVSGDAIVASTGALTVVKINGTPVYGAATTFIGMGTETNPQATLVVSKNAQTGITASTTGITFLLIGADGANAGIEAQRYGAGSPAFNGRSANGTGASPTVVTAGNILWRANGLGCSVNGGTYYGSSSITQVAAETWSSTAGGSFIALSTTPLTTATLIEAVRIQPSGGVSIGNTTDTGLGSLNANGVVVTKGYTVATLPSTAATGKVQGARAFVTDALGPTFLAIVAAGGAVITPVFYNGTNWVCG